MFFRVEREDTVAVKPAFFGQNIEKHVMRLVRGKVEGRCTGRFGYTVLVTDFPEMGERKHEGRLLESGEAEFRVKYVSLVFRPLLHEVLPAVVSRVTAEGFFAQAGPCKIFVSRTQVPDDYRFNTGGRDGGNSWVNEDESVRIEKGSSVRVKIEGIRFVKDDIKVIGTIREDFLGVLEGGL